MTIHYDDVEIENVGTCDECGEENILDSSLKICFDCWCVLDLKNQEQLREEE
jgi:hypothetical protein